MKKLILALALLLAPSIAWAQCSGAFPNNTVCGNITGTTNTPRSTPLGSIVTSTYGIKQPVDVATTANITLSGEQTIDGVLTSTSRVLVKDQSISSQNGIYVSSVGAWVRASDFSVAGQVVQGTLVKVTQGVANGNTIFAVTTANPIVPGSTSIAWGKSIGQPNAGSLAIAGCSLGTNVFCATGGGVFNTGNLALNGGYFALGRSTVPTGYANYQITQETPATTTALTGTVSLTAGTKSVTGTGTAFLSQLSAGNQISIAATGEVLKVASISTDTALTVTTTVQTSATNSAANKVTYTYDGILRTLQVVRRLYAGDGTTSNSAGIKLDATIADGVKTDYYGIASEITLANNYSGGGDGGQAVGVAGVTNAYGSRKAWAGFFQANDFNNYSTPSDVLPLTGVEINAAGIGLDHPTERYGAGLRKILAVTPKNVPGYSGGEIGVGLDIRPDSSTILRYAINVYDTDATNPITYGERIQTRGTYGLVVDGENSDSQIIARSPAGIGKLKVGSLQNTATELSNILFTGLNSVGSEKTYGRIRGYSSDATSTSEDGRIDIQTIVGGTLTLEARIENGIRVGLPSGGSPGAGSINVAGNYYINGAQIAAANLSNGVTGTGAIVLANTPTLITPVLGVATGTSIALGGCTPGSDALCVTGTATVSGNQTAGAFVPSSSSVPTNGLYLNAGNTLGIATNSSNRFTITSSGILSNSSTGAQITASSTNSTTPSIIPRRADATTGIGSQAAGNVSMIVTGAEVTRFMASGIQMIKNYTVGILPTCNAGAQGSLTYVTDALAPAFLTAVTGGGTVVSPVFCNGSNWVSM